MIQFYDTDTHTWKLSRFPWTTEDITWLNDTVGWPMYRTLKEAA